MRKRDRWSDVRLVGYCAHCGGPYESVDHIPSKILLDKPYPADLHTVESCIECNQRFSPHEEYVACLVECVIAGSSEPGDMTRPKVKATLQTNPALRERIFQSKRVIDGRTYFVADSESLQPVLTKLARGHLTFETSGSRPDEPSFVSWLPLTEMSTGVRAEYETSHRAGEVLFPEIGSRSFSDAVIDRDIPWTIVQADRYRFQCVTTSEAQTVKFVLSEYLACEVAWVA